MAEQEFPVNFTVLKTALWSVPIGVVITDNRQADNPIVYCNPKFSDMTGYQAEDILGRSCRFLQGFGTDQSVVDKLRSALAHGSYFQEEILNYKKDGTPFFNQLTISPIHDAGGEISHFIGFQNDITRQIAAEQNLTNAYSELTKINTRLTQFAKTLAHDLKTPIATIAMAADVLESMDCDSTENAELLSTIATSSRNITTLIDEVLINTLRSYSQKSEVSLTEVLEAATDHFPKELAERIHQRVPLPVVSCNRTQLLQVFQNLLSNAFKHGSPSDPMVHIDCEEKDQAWLISIIDNGPGVPETLKDVIFEPFVKHVQNDPPISSHGIGLDTVKRIIDEHQGRIWVDSVAEGGACFRFTLPKV